MAFNIPSGLYHGAGQVVLNTQPSVNFAAQLMAKQQAKMDSLNQYYGKTQQNLLEKENKMRPQDVTDPDNPNRGWMQDFNSLQSNYLKNRQAILQPRSPQDYQTKAAYESHYNQLMSNAAKSVNLQGETNKLVNKITFSGGKYVPTDNDHMVLDTYEKSIYNPDRTIDRPDPVTGVKVTKEPNLQTDLSLGLPPLDSKSLDQFNKNNSTGIKQDMTYDPKTIQKDPATGKLIVNEQFGYSPDKIKAAADRVPDKLNPYTREGAGFENMLTQIHQDPTSEAVKRYNDAFQSVYGKTDKDGNPNIVDTPSKLAKANLILDMQSQGGVRQKMVTDLPAQQQFQLTKMAKQQEYRQADIRLSSNLTEGRADYNRAQNSGEQDQVLNNFFNKAYDAGTNDVNGKQVNKVTVDGTDYHGKVVDLPPAVTNSFAKFDKYDPATLKPIFKQPSAMFMTDDKKYVIPIFDAGTQTQDGKGYNLTSDSKPHLMQNAKMALAKELLPKSKTGAEVTSEDGTPAPAAGNKKSYNPKTGKFE
jgi:hypothetical protein